MVAGGLSANGLTKLHICEPNITITGQYYRESILPNYINVKSRGETSENIDERKLFSFPNHIVFMQDGAPAHTANMTISLLNQNFVKVWSKNVWPGNSPDLNPIEHLWNYLQHSVFLEPRPRNRDDLVSRLQTTWKSVTAQQTERLIYSFPGRIRQVLDRRGYSTTY
jgi:hypothetical protein